MFEIHDIAMVCLKISKDGRKIIYFIFEMVQVYIYFDNNNYV
jgi:hypothetical protein